jgi:hypothetical protein
MDSIPCTLCGAQLARRQDKHGKPYFVCEPCGVQFFIRRKQGIKHLDELIEMIKLHQYHFREHTHVLCEIQAVLAEIRGVKKEMKTLEQEFDLLSSKKDQRVKQRTLEALDLRIRNCLSQLSQLARMGTRRVTHDHSHSSAEK